jgi:hypothetical protein
MCTIEGTTFCHPWTGLHDPCIRALQQLAQIPSPRSGAVLIGDSALEEGKGGGAVLQQLVELAPLWGRVGSLLDVSSEVNQISPKGILELISLLTELIKFLMLLSTF